MKITIDVDLSPQEARELMGWPDMSQLHEATMKYIEEQLKAGNQDVMMSVLKPYLEGSQQAFSIYQRMFESLATSSQSNK